MTWRVTEDLGNRDRAAATKKKGNPLSVPQGRDSLVQGLLTEKNDCPQLKTSKKCKKTKHKKHETKRTNNIRVA